MSSMLEEPAKTRADLFLENYGRMFSDQPGTTLFTATTVLAIWTVDRWHWWPPAVLFVPIFVAATVALFYFAVFVFFTGFTLLGLSVCFLDWCGWFFRSVLRRRK